LPLRFGPSASAAVALAAAIFVAGTASASAEAYLLIEADSGKVLQAENATYPWYPASVTKLMTLYVTLKAVKSGRITLDTPFTISPNAVAQAPTKMGFKAGTQVTVDNALKMMMVKSANDIAMLLAEGVGGSIDGFITQMNDAAQRLGMVQTSYVNPNGLPADGQITSARDLGILARALIKEFPEYDFYWHVPAIKFGRRVFRNYNALIDRYPGADGMKTGFICASGFNLVASATRNNRRLIAVVLGAPSASVRTAKAAKMLEQGFNSGGLSWLLPSLGTVDSLVPINTDPPNLRDTTCGPHRKRPAAEDEEVDVNAGEGPTPLAYLLSSSSTPKGSALVGASNMSAPVEVFVGATKPVNALAAAAQETAIAAPPRRGKKKTSKTANAKQPAKSENVGDQASPTDKPGAKDKAGNKPAASNPDSSAKTSAKSSAKNSAKTAARPQAANTKPVAQ
jgi:D-alanyl-D-alanine carboxypeptidase